MPSRLLVRGGLEARHIILGHTMTVVGVLRLTPGIDGFRVLEALRKAEKKARGAAEWTTGGEGTLVGTSNENRPPEMIPVAL